MATLPQLKSFSLTHILYDSLAPKYLSIPLTLLSLSPIFLFVSYFTLLVFNRKLSILLLGLGSIANEGLSWGLKRMWKGERPYVGMRELGDGYGMPSSHTQAAAFLVAWGIGYAMTLDKRKAGTRMTAQSSNLKPSTAYERRRAIVTLWRVRIYLFGLVLWSLLVAYSRWYLLYHSPSQVIAGYWIGFLAGSVYFCSTEYLPLTYPNTFLGKTRTLIEWLWGGVGGAGGWDIGGLSPGGWGEGWIFLGTADDHSTAHKSR